MGIRHNGGFFEPKYYYARADELRCIADGMQDIQSRETMLMCAADYDRLGERAQQHLGHKTPDSGAP